MLLPPIHVDYFNPVPLPEFLSEFWSRTKFPDSGSSDDDPLWRFRNMEDLLTEPSREPLSHLVPAPASGLSADDEVRVTRDLGEAILKEHENGEFQKLGGLSASHLFLLKKIRSVAAEQHPVFIYGESGTGKELVAQSLARVMRRTCHTINLGTINPSLAMSDLFGFVRGAHSTALDRNREGMFERAGTGVLFLDEIGNAPDEVQAALLRVTEYGEFAPVGSDDVKYSEARIVAAYNRPLAPSLLEITDPEMFRILPQESPSEAPNLHETPSPMPAWCEGRYPDLARETPAQQRFFSALKAVGHVPHFRRDLFSRLAVGGAHVLFLPPVRWRSVTEIMFLRALAREMATRTLGHKMDPITDEELRDAVHLVTPDNVRAIIGIELGIVRLAKERGHRDARPLQDPPFPEHLKKMRQRAEEMFPDIPAPVYDIVRDVARRMVRLWDEKTSTSLTSTRHHHGASNSQHHENRGRSVRDLSMLEKIKVALKKNDGHVTHAAESLDIHRTQINAICHRHRTTPANLCTNMGIDHDGRGKRRASKISGDT